MFIRAAVSGKEWRKMTILQVPQTIFQTTRNADDRREESSPRKTSTAVTSRAIWWAGFVLACEQGPPGERGGNWPEFSESLHPKTHSWSFFFSAEDRGALKCGWVHFRLADFNCSRLRFMQICTVEALTQREFHPQRLSMQSETFSSS